MSGKKQRLELTWIGKDERPKLEPRILLEDPERSYASSHHTMDLFDNRLIHGDNLLALKALETEFLGRIKCVIIDPPYNTGSAFTHYDDGVEHSIWLSLIRQRIQIMHSLLADNGSLWITIDDNEVHYLKILVDDIFGRNNFLANIVWQSKDTPGNNSSGIAQTHNHILCFQKSPSFQPNLLGRNAKQIATYKNPDSDPNGPWLGTPLTRGEHRDRDVYPIKNQAGRDVLPPKGSSWRRPPARMKDLQAQGRIYWGKDGNAEFPVEKKYLSEVKEGVVNQTWWPYEFAGSTRNASAELKDLFDGEKSFDTPKPEKLIQRIIDLASDPGDWVLDSFAGSGTTGAVAHKTGRRWIMVELGEHCRTHIIPRLRKVIDGEDKGGASETVEWEGGGGFRYFRLAPSLLEKDRWGNWIIARSYNAAMLAEAMCKHMGFTYAPSQDLAEYWRHGCSSERDFIFVTTANVTHDQLRAISEDVGPERTLLVCCKAFNARADAFENLTVKKIPQAVLSRCEWGRDDYSLRIAEAPPPPEERAERAPAPRRGGKTSKLPLFDEVADET